MIEIAGAAAESLIPMLMSGSLYFHIPFCTKKCSYCHFYVIPDKDPFKKMLMRGFKQEWDRWFPEIKDKKIVSVYFGGGTPALIGPDAIAEILSWVKVDRGVEVTLEANPENINRQLMQEFSQAGVNRVSIGIQTFDNALLKKLGRIHDAGKGVEAVHATAEAGIGNISIDLMYDLPLQTIGAWENTLQQACELPITHLSLYNLTIEPHTVFFKYRESIQKQLPEEDVSLEMYKMAIKRLAGCGLQQYEISAFAKNDAYSRHNVGYWTARPFLGFGPSAFSYWQGKRFRNVANLNRYCQALDIEESPVDFEEQLDPDASRRELLVIELRLLKGICVEDFQVKHGLLEKKTLEKLTELLSQGLLQQLDDRVALSSIGILFYDTIASELI